MRLILLVFLSVFALRAQSQTVIYSEDFQTGLPVSYTIVDNDGFTPNAQVSEFSPAWIALEDPDNLSDTVVGSTSYFDPEGRADRWLITPAITLGAFGNVLFWEGKSHDASFPDGYHVYVSTTDTELTSFTDTIFTIGGESENWNPHDVSLSSEGYNNMTVHIAFVNRTYDGFKLYLDDIRVESENPLDLNYESIDFASVFPNPTTDIINVKGSFDRLELITTRGELLKTTDQSNLDLRNLENGVYLIRIVKNDHYSVQRIIKL